MSSYESLLDSNFASIDIGSHTVRLLIARLAGGREILPVHLDRSVTRLARNFQEGETLEEVAMEQSVKAVMDYAKLMKRYNVQAAACGATGVVRRAKNATDFLKLVKGATGISVSVLSEESEAFLSAKGSLSVLPDPRGIVLSFDLGGSSTEFVLMDVRQKKTLWSTSVFIGAATVTERCIFGDPVESSSVSRAISAIRNELDPVLSTIKDSLHSVWLPMTPFQVVGTAGTVTTLGAMYLKMVLYQPYRVNGLQLTEGWLTETIDLLAELPLASRRELPGLEAGREDIIFGGALIVREILRGLGQDRLTVTDGGLLEGLFLELIEKECGWPNMLVTPLVWRL